MKIAVVGAGLSGLVSIKECLQHGFEVTCFEKSNVIGGAWNYRNDGSITVAKRTVSLTSKHMMAFSDFPMPEDYPTFLHHSYYIQYLMDYVEKFDLKRHIKLDTRVISLTKSDRYETTGQWHITYQEKGKEPATDTFDGVFVANSKNYEINRPEIEGIENFRGRIFDAQSFKDASSALFEDRRVLIIGFGHSALDAATALASTASRVYMICRDRELWCSSRQGWFGMPHDYLTETRFCNWLYDHVPHLATWLFELMTNLKFDWDTVGKCENRKLISSKTHILTDDLPFYIESGQIIVKPGLRKFVGQNRVEFEDSSSLAIDDVILCTGYKSGLSAFDDTLGRKFQSLGLYKLMYPVHVGDRVEHNTLCFVGQTAQRGAALPIAEMQARYHCAVLGKRILLPNYDSMQKEITRFCGREAGLSRLQIRVLPYIDELAEQLGVKPTFWNYLFSDPSFAVKSLFMAAVPYQFRLQGDGAWDGAKEAMLESWRLKPVINRGQVSMVVKSNGRRLEELGKICSESKKSASHEYLHCAKASNPAAVMFILAFLLIMLRLFF